ncbi:MAG: S8 family serine peptidase [Gemmatimonadetes bacterium]|nr:S8 family serine peptidase [Gemmatimonadota bacterium]
MTTNVRLASGIEAAVAAGADVLSLSWSAGDSERVRRALQRATRTGRGRGCVVVAAAGSDGGECASRLPRFRGGGGGRGSGRPPGARRGWSSTTGRKWTSWPRDSHVHHGAQGWLHPRVPGTSAATALAAGASAMVLRANPDLTAKEVRDLLIATAVVCNDTVGGRVVALKVINVAAAVRAALGREEGAMRIGPRRLVLGMLLWAGRLASQGVPTTDGVYSLDSLVTSARMAQACDLFTWRGELASAAADIATLRQSLAAARAGLAGASSDRRDELREEVAADSTDLAKAEADLQAKGAPPSTIPDSTVRALEWVCKIGQGAGTIRAEARIPSVAEVLVTAARVDSGRTATSNKALGVGGLFGAIGLDEAKLLSGLTKFLMDRASAEIRIAFIERLTNNLCPLGRPTSVLFARACGILEQDQLALRAADFRELRLALRQDLTQLPRTGPLAALRRLDSTTSAPPGGAEEPGDLRRRRDLLLGAYAVGTMATLMLKGKDLLRALTDMRSADASAATRRGLLEHELSSRSARDYPIAAVLQRVSLLGAVLPDTNVDGYGDWPANADARLQVLRAMIVNANAWLRQLDSGVPSVWRPRCTRRERRWRPCAWRTRLWIRWCDASAPGSRKTPCCPSPLAPWTQAWVSSPSGCRRWRAVPAWIPPCSRRWPPCEREWAPSHAATIRPRWWPRSPCCA